MNNTIQTGNRKIAGSAGNILRTIGGLAADFLYPPRCALCERPLLSQERFVCAACAKTLSFVPQPRCMCCGKPIRDPQAEFCPDCQQHTHSFDRGRAAFLYEKRVRRSVDRLKFCNCREYIPFYGYCLAMLLRQEAALWQPECLIPIPMHPKKRAERGFDQAALLAKEAGRISGVPVREDLLLRTRYTASSKKLGASSRRKNLRGAFRVPEGAVIPGSVVLIDDIYTTGTTMDEAALALRRAGAGRIWFLAVCTGRGDS